MASTTVQRHQWTHDGKEVMILKCVPKNGFIPKDDTHADFQWPLTVGATVEAPDWKPQPECGHGLHGWPWGFALGDGKDLDWSATWVVFSVLPSDVVDLGGKCKAKCGTIRFVGGWDAAWKFVLAGQMAYVFATAEGEHATGDCSASSAMGDRSTSSATGYRSTSSATGDCSASSATGDGSASSAMGDRSTSSATGYRSTSSATGDCSASVVTGLYGKARAGKFGCIALAWWNEAERRSEMKCLEIGIGDGTDGKLKADVWYELTATGEFHESETGGRR